MATNPSNSHSLEREFAYYSANKGNLDSQYRGKFIVIKDETVLGPFDDQNSALREALKTYQAGTFLIQLCGEGPQAVQYFHSRVTFR
jgi:hypothetical protein